MSQDMKRTVGLYRRLFRLPQSHTLVLITSTLAITIGALIELVRNLGAGGIIDIGIGAARGLFIILPAALLAMGIIGWGTRDQGILNRHRLIGMAMAGAFTLLGIWFLSTLIGRIAEFILVWPGITDLVYRRSFILAAAFTTALVFLIVLSLSTLSSFRVALVSHAFSTGSIILFILTEPFLVISGTWWIYLSVYLFATTLFTLASHLLLTAVGRPLKKTIKVDGMKLFRGFLAVWIEGRVEQMESSLSQIGHKISLPLAILRFTPTSSKPSLVYVVSGVHPGPFKNVGSSDLPGIIAEWGRGTLDTIACAPHGTATHDLNLVSQDEVNRFMTMVNQAYSQVTNVETVSQFARATSGTIQAGCQLFGDTALIVISRSPYEMDDISLPVGKRIAEEVEKFVNQSIIVDTHNCMTELKESVYLDSDICPEMLEAAVTATKLALKLPQGNPRVGVAKRLVTEFSEKEGMGPEGITVSVIEVAKQRTAYVLIDGNNMITGLRDTVHQTLVPELVDEAEILTTDTHQTAALSTRNGYSSIGEAIPHTILIEMIKALVQEAIEKLESVKVARYTGETEPLHVMGEGTVEKLTELIPISASIAKRVGVTAFGSAFLLSLLVLILTVV